MSDKPKIVIADDDLSDRYLINMAFEEAGFDLNIEEFEDGAQLIDFLNDGGKDAPPRFILLDINMPKKTGLDVLEFIKSNPGVCQAPVVMLSTSSDPKDISRSKELGAAEYIVKPVDYLGYVEIARSLKKYL
jgi:CheY-like chemotaxis protein